MSGISTVMAAITALLGPVTEDDQKGPDTMQDLLTSCIAFTGDVDTVAAIAMPVGALCPDIEKNLPQALYDGLENGEYGLDYLKTLDQELLAIFPRPGTEVEIDPSKLSLTDDATDDADELLDFMEIYLDFILSIDLPTKSYASLLLLSLNHILLKVSKSSAYYEQYVFGTYFHSWFLTSLFHFFKLL